MDCTPVRNPASRCSEQVSTTIHMLSPEVLSEIFLHCLDVDIRCGTRTRIRSRAPLLLGRICSRWRIISIATSELWSSFTVGEVGDEPPKRVDCKMDLEATTLWLARSGSRPLSIGIHYSQDCENDPLLPQVLEAIVSQSWRWKEIEMSIPFKFESVLLAPFTSTLPHLVDFSSTIIKKNRLTTPIHTFILSSAPQIQRLHLKGVSVRVHVDFGGQTHDIRNLNITEGYTTFTDMVYNLTYCPLLISLNLWVGTSSTSISASELPTLIELPYLRHLTLAFYPAANPRLLFDRLLLPALVSLEIRRITSSTNCSSLQSFLARSRPPLQILTLTNIPMHEATLTECISYTPALTELSAMKADCTDVTAEALTLDDKSENGLGGLCPLLEKVSFDAAGCSDSAVTKMILSRCTSSRSTIGTTRKPLKYLFLGMFDVDRLRTNPEIAECIEDGLLLD